MLIPQQHADGVVVLIDRQQVRPAVSIHVRDRNGAGFWGGKGLLGPKRPISVAQPHTDVVAAVVGEHQVRFAIAIQVGHRPGAGPEAHGVEGARLERRDRRRQQHPPFQPFRLNAEGRPQSIIAFDRLAMNVAFQVTKTLPRLPDRGDDLLFSREMTDAQFTRSKPAGPAGPAPPTPRTPPQIENP